MTPTVFIVLPAYNEETALASLIPDIAKTLRGAGVAFRICLVNDGSWDGTAAQARSFPPDDGVELLTHETNRGYGAALRTGFLWIVRNARPDDCAISLDADRTHLPVYLLAMLRKLEEGYDVVTASYLMPGGRVYGVPFKRRLMSAVANGLFRLGCPISGTRAYTNGFRAYRVSALQRAYQEYGEKLIEETGFPGGTELLLKVGGLGARTTEVPFDLHYENRGNQSKIHIGQTAGGYLALLSKSRSFVRRPARP